MTAASTVFFCHVIGAKVLTSEGKKLGRLRDLIADPTFARPEIIAAVVSCADGLKTLDFSTARVETVKGRHVFVLEKIKPADLQRKETIQVRQLLNKKVVDMNRRNTITAYDVLIAMQNDRSTIVAVDAGAHGRLRQMGLDRYALLICKALDLTIPNQLVMWDNVEAFNISKTGTGLSRSMSKLNRLHPSEMADIIEEMDDNTKVEIFSAMDAVRAADVLEELEPNAQDSLLESLPSEKIVDVLEIMPADEVADILDEVDKEKAEELLKEMDSEVSGEVRELMEYEDDEVGSLMMTDFISLRESDTVENALAELRRMNPDYDLVYSLYVVAESGALVAALSLRDIMLADPEARIADIMNRDIVSVRDTDKIETLNDIIAKYNLLAVPVVNEEGLLLGSVIINDAFFSLLRSRRKR